MVIIINPIDPTIKCLRRTCRIIADHTGANLYWVFPGEYKRIACRTRIEACSEDDLVVFLGHGRSEALFGSKGKWYNHDWDVSEEAMSLAPNRYYLDNNLFDATCLHLFKGKKCILFACNSDEFGEKLVQSGCRVVLGFNRLPSSIDELKNDWHIDKADRQMASALSGCLNVAFRNALVNSIRCRHTFSEFEDVLRFEFNSQVGQLMKTKAIFKATISDVLLRIARDVRIIGDRNCSLI